MIRPPVICLMGPTASGKTEVAMRLADRFPVDLISVDSALVYRHMNIGTAKPEPETLCQYPHRLIDIRNPEENYSAGDFVRDANREIDMILAANRIPLLVGGTMLYFRALIDGIANLPEADANIRAEIDREAASVGWPALHAELAEVDKVAAERISPNDSQRIQRALEVYRSSGKPLSAWHAQSGRPVERRFVKFALLPEPRAALHARIEKRLHTMLENGFLDEVRALQAREGLTEDLPSMRAVGYRQFWRHVAGVEELQEATDKALAATRQLAKRQITWLRSETDIVTVNPLETDPVHTISAHIAREIGS